MKIIGIGGTNGAGKDTLASWLADTRGWHFVSVSGDLLIPELNKRGDEISRNNMSSLSSEWRRSNGMGAVIDKAVDFAGKNNASGLIIASLRHPGEVDRIHELNGNVIWIDADPKVRYERIYNRGQGSKDQKTFEQFLAEEQAEMKPSGDNATLDMASVKEKSDIFIQNDTQTQDEFIALAKKSLSFDAN